MRAIRTNRESLAQQIAFNPTLLYAQRLQIRKNLSIVSNSIYNTCSSYIDRLWMLLSIHALSRDDAGISMKASSHDTVLRAASLRRGVGNSE
jgi:hypothetical protein